MYQELNIDNKHPSACKEEDHCDPHEIMTSSSYLEKSSERSLSPQPFGRLRASLDLSLWQANHILERLNVAMEKVDGALETLEGPDGKYMPRINLEPLIYLLLFY